MKKIGKRIGILVIILVIFLTGLAVFSKLYYKRSLQASLAEWYLKFTVTHVSSQEMEKALSERKAMPEEAYVFPEDTKMKGGVEKADFEGMPVLYFNKSGKGKKILYLHGGSYLHHPDPHHFAFLNQLIEKNDAKVILPVYPKTPKHDFAETYELVTKLYQEISKEEEIVLMGDSAGGGLILGLAQYINDLDLKEPLGIISFSPWLDLAMENPEIKEYEKVDPWLRLASSLPIAKSWANGTDLKDYRISPTFGNLQGFRNLTIFTGTREILYPDIMLFTDKLKAKGVDFQLIIGEGLNHVYPLFPIPEGAEAIEQVAEIMNHF